MSAGQDAAGNCLTCGVTCLGCLVGLAAAAVLPIWWLSTLPPGGQALGELYVVQWGLFGAAIGATLAYCTWRIAKDARAARRAGSGRIGSAAGGDDDKAGADAAETRLP